MKLRTFVCVSLAIAAFLLSAFLLLLSCPRRELGHCVAGGTIEGATDQSFILHTSSGMILFMWRKEPCSHVDSPVVG